MAASEAKLDRFDHLVPVEPWANPWQPDGTYLADEDLLARLLSSPSAPPSGLGSSPLLPTSGQQRSCDGPVSMWTRYGRAE